ncbi:MAG TPA: UDP-2,3-diacylglucosamine hydrolase [Alphaproteobacteria bacterium]|nr:UDP-2,3-diacylglucosamine hydrolase [Alphaproteobacteria bacterium]HBF98201.1 UDP-2,3-diacylglucosamine hydrolase [Alphaproteobacteria bacterium]
MGTTIETRKYRTLFISDIHLGTRGCKAEQLLEFLKYCEADKIYLIGDIFDGWRLKRNWYWPQAHNDVVQKLLRKARKGTQIVYIPGNHDSSLRNYCGTHFGGIEVKLDDIHETADGRRMYVTHGDDFDVVVKYAKWLAVLGDWAYTALLNFNTHFNHARKWLGLEYWSLSAYLKVKVKNAVQFIESFEVAISEEAEKRQVDGVICGHIHHAEMRQWGEVLYINDGDWVESCSAAVEHPDGRFEIIRWEQLKLELLANRQLPKPADLPKVPKAA